MRILHVTYIFPPKPNVADGITNVVYNVTKELAKKGHQVTVFASNLAGLHQSNMLPTGHHRINNVDVFYFRCLQKYKTFAFTPSIVNELRYLDYFDIVHVHDARSFQGICTYLWGKMKFVPYVFQPHGSFLSLLREPYGLRMLKLLLDKLVSGKILKNSSKIITLSRVEAEQYRRMGVPEEKIAIIPNGIDLSEYANLPPKGTFKRKFGIPEDKKVILYLGRIHRIKGIDILVRAYAYSMVKMGYEDAVLVIAGPDDGFLSEVKSLVQYLGISRHVIFTGPLYGKECYDTFPNVVLEAYACFKPVIASNVEAIPDIVLQGETGLLFQAGNIRELARAITYMLMHPEDAEKMGCNARKLVEEKFYIDKVVTHLEILKI